LARVDDRELAGAARSAKAQALLAEILATPAAAPRPKSRSERVVSKRRRRGRLALAAALLGATGAAVVVGYATRGSPVPETVSAADVLRQAARAAQAQPPLLLKSGQSVYTKSITAHLTAVRPRPGHGQSYALLAVEVRDSWRGRNGGRLRVRRGRPQFLSARDRAAWIAAGRPLPLVVGLRGERLPALHRLALPSDPIALYRRLRHRATGQVGELYPGMLTLIGEVLHAANATPAQRAALYTVAAQLPGVKLLGPTTDPIGRHGAAVAIANGVTKLRQVLIFDPQTSALLAEEELTLKGNDLGYPPETRIGYTVYLTTAVVRSRITLGDGR
jgi:hypothetical protein